MLDENKSYGNKRNYAGSHKKAFLEQTKLQTPDQLLGTPILLLFYYLIFLA